MPGWNGRSWGEFTQELACELAQAAALLRSTSAIHDPVTSLPSAAYLEMRLLEEIARAERMKIPFSLVAVTIMEPQSARADSVDQLVQQAAGLLRRHLRAMDVVARTNQLEFFCLIPEAAAEQAAAIAHRLANLAGKEGAEPGLHLAAAAVSFPQDGADPAALMAAARLALVRARTADFSRRVTSPPPAAKEPTGKTVQAAPAAEPVAVGFVSGRRFPVSYWHGSELVPIEAVLEEHSGEGETALVVQTAKGVARLVQQGRRWFLTGIPSECSAADSA